MRKSGLILIGFCFVLVGIYVESQSQPYEMIEIATGADPHWSLDGTQLAYVYKGALYVKNADGTGEAQKIAELPSWTDGFDWLDSTEFVFWGKEYKRIGGKGRQYTETRIKTLIMDGKEKLVAETVDGPEDVRTLTRISVPMFLPDRTVGYYESPYEDVFLEKSEKKVFKIIKQGKLPPDSAMKQMRALVLDLSKTGEYIDRSLWVQSMDGSIRKKVRQCNFCSFPKLSRDGTKILAVCGAMCGTCVINLEGNITCVGKESINPYDPQDTTFLRGSVAGQPTWSPDSKKIAYGYVRYKSISEHDVKVLESEIYTENPDGTEKVQITDTPDKIEVNPVWSPDGERIVCRDQNTAKIYVIKFK